LYDEEEEVNEMYFITTGTVSVGFSLYMNGHSKGAKSIEMTYDMTAPSTFGGYYLTRNLRSQFLYKANTNVEMFSLSKEFLFKNIATKFPVMFDTIKEYTKTRYQVISSHVLPHKNSAFLTLNSRATYKYTLL
jgi:hypothetical protein